MTEAKAGSPSRGALAAREKAALAAACPENCFAGLGAAAHECGSMRQFFDKPPLDSAARARASDIARELAQGVRNCRKKGMLEEIMLAHSLSSAEGRSLMELAEALLRVPDTATRDALIRDKIPGHHWLSGSPNALVNAADAALAAAGLIVRKEDSGALGKMANRLGMPVVRECMLAAMKFLGGQFVLAETIRAALRAVRSGKGRLYSFDMLGEGARTREDALRYLGLYEEAVREAANLPVGAEVHANSGVSVKLSALHPRFESRQRKTTLPELTARLLHLAVLAKDRNIPLTVDAEEMARINLLVEVFAAVAASPRLAGWDGFGIVVQAYGLHAGRVIDLIDALAARHARRFAVRLVKGAYWDSEIKAAQEKGLDGFPVYTRKAHTDLAYLAHARSLLRCAGRLWPQFATHNAATLAAVETLAAEHGNGYEVQRLHGMGEALHGLFQRRFARPMRIYAPVGGHDELLAYLSRRLLENGANSSFVHKISDPGVPVEAVVREPHAAALATHGAPFPGISTGAALFGAQRRNSRGRDLDDPAELGRILHARERFRDARFLQFDGARVRADPGCPGDRLPVPCEAGAAQIGTAFAEAHKSMPVWRNVSRAERAKILDAVADAYESRASELYALLAREAGKTVDDAVAEVREAVDFCRYYAAQLRALPVEPIPRGVVLAISPWNFPLAIFTGQIAAALAAGNAVVAKPAEQTPLLAELAAGLMHGSGVPSGALRLLHGRGETVGARAAALGQADMVAFTGSTAAAHAIHRAIAGSSRPGAPLLAETGGLNAMIVDSTALTERAVDDIVTSAFRSAGQRCSALRVVYVQEDIAAKLEKMLVGAAELLRIADPWEISSDVGPLIDVGAKRDVDGYVEGAASQGRLIWRGNVPQRGCYAAPAIVRVAGIGDLDREVFGPVLHFATFAGDSLGKAVADINAAGYGLTFCLHSRIVQRQQEIAKSVEAGNIYINRNQTGAVVGSQAFGGYGLSGTGPKAGGPLYLRAFTDNVGVAGAPASGTLLRGPDGEENRYVVLPKGHVLCTGAGPLEPLAELAASAGNKVSVAEQVPSDLCAYDAVMANGGDIALQAAVRGKLACQPGKIVSLITRPGDHVWLVREKHICADLTASGGNPVLLNG